MAGVIPKDKLGGFQRWNIGSLDENTQALSVADTAPPSIASASTVPQATEARTTHSQATLDELQRSHEAARAEGYSTGYREGLEAAQQAMAITAAESSAQFAELLGNLHISLAHLDQHIAEQLLDLALEVAAQVLRGTIRTRPELLLPVIREAVAALPLHHAHVILRMNPADSPLIREQIGEQLAQTGTQIIDDPAISPGGCLLTAGTSEIDATIETRWKRVLESIGTTPSEWMNQP
ncbi:flagellar assembly protein FliH [Dechloromonas sp. HYN0024]|uniref:flagellar assembly protein FliH n=1 Tax=Dechloromonas sp. HYN0024 TaxID=2231055 RepID=UPI000E451871|nr:flagellar assembly protein FliH [Dechloromonas sp. HYN0024]AXS79188.1 flagellar assembly protein FliH [Dechloromonas sp. HYN0024]